MQVVIDGKNIFRVDHTNTKMECVGVIAEEYLAMKEDAEQATELAEQFHEEKQKYMELLIENGLMERPKTQEEINEELKQKLVENEEVNRKLQEQLMEQGQMNEKLLGAIELLSSKLEGVTNGSEQNKGNSKESRSRQQQAEPSN